MVINGLLLAQKKTKIGFKSVMGSTLLVNHMLKTMVVILNGATWIKMKMGKTLSGISMY